MLLSNIFSKLIRLSLHRFLTLQNEIACEPRPTGYYLFLSLDLLHVLASLGFLNHGTNDIWGWIVLYCGGCPVHFRKQCLAGSLAYTLDASGTLFPHPTPSCDNQNVSRYYQMSLGSQY